MRFQRLLCAGLRVRVRVHGELSPDSQLIVANHVSWLDIPVLGSLAPMSFLAKKEVGDHPVGRELVAMQGAVYVERGRRFRIPAVNAEMARVMRGGSPVVLFAEATTGDGNRLLPFRTSHFEAARLAAGGDGPAAIQPVLLRYSRLAGLPLDRTRRPKVAWYGDMTFLPHLFAYAEFGRRDLRRLLRPADPRACRYVPQDGRAPYGGGGAAARRACAGERAGRRLASGERLSSDRPPLRASCFRAPVSPDSILSRLCGPFCFAIRGVIARVVCETSPHREEPRKARCLEG